MFMSDGSQAKESEYACPGLRNYLLDEFERYMNILTNLKDDPEKFVQKSVGNNLNDLYKDAPEKADFIISQWEKTGKSKAQDWIIKHGRRNAGKL